METLKPYFEVGGKRYELKRTRALLVKFQQICKANKMDDEEAGKFLQVRDKFERMEKEINLLNEKIEVARNEYYDDPTNADKAAKYQALNKILEETQRPLLDGKSTEMAYLDKVAKSMLDNYEIAIVYAISEQYDMSEENAKKVWSAFVEEIGESAAGEWVYAIGDTLFNTEAEENDFLAQKRRQQDIRVAARRKKSN